MKKLLESIDSIEEKKNTPTAPATPRNPVAKNAMATIGGGGFGKHKNKKKSEQSGREKHKGSFMRDLAETAEETRELRKLKESWKNFQKESDKKLEEYGAQSTDPNAQSTNADQQGGMTAQPPNTNQQNKAVNTYNNVQQNSPQTTGTRVNTSDDPIRVTNFMKTPQFKNKLNTDQTFKMSLIDLLNNAGLNRFNTK